MSAAQIISSLNITVSDKELIAKLDNYLTAANASSTKLAVFSHIPDAPLYVKFAPGPGGNGEKPIGRWGVGLFQGDKEAPPTGVYKLVIENDTAKVINGELEVWYGKGQQQGLDGHWIVELNKN